LGEPQNTFSDKTSRALIINECSPPVIESDFIDFFARSLYFSAYILQCKISVRFPNSQGKKLSTESTDIVENIIELLPDQAEQVLILQKETLESVALGHNYQLILDQLCKGAEALVPNSLASVMLFNEDKSSLIVKSAPSMPIAAKEQLTGLVPGETAGSCGTAVYNNEPQFVCNTVIDPRWATFSQYIKDFFIGACWSMPIRSLNGNSIGSFALSSYEERIPSDFHKHLLATSSSLASIVLNRHDEQTDLEFAAHHDALTNLPNRTLFSLRLNHAIDVAKRKDKILALLFMDLDNFKVINDTQGHEVGDQILKVAAQTMKNCVRETDTLARLGGDEFVLLVDDIDDEVELRHVADKILSAFESPVEINDRLYTLTTSIGISVYPNDGDSADMLLQTSDTAMYEAKAQGRNTYVYYKPELTTLVHERVKLESELRTAIINKDLVVYYQPIYSMGKNEIVAVEALVRWQHAEKGLIPPDDFIYLAEETGLINDLGKYVVKTACQQCLRWWLDDLKEFTLSVNISAKQVEVGYSNVLIEALKEINFPFSNLELEVTESLVMQSSKTVLAELEKIREVGINISMDDFGIGHSSLSQLKTLPIVKLKIDKSFVLNIPDDQDDMVIAKTIIAMGHSLGLVVVAEGVETEEQKQFLQSEKCDLLQGYYFSRPVPADEFEKLLRDL